MLSLRFRSELNSNYRVIKHIGASKREQWFAIHVVFYDEGGEVSSYSQEPEFCAANSIEDLRLQADKIRNACEQDILIAKCLDASIAQRRRQTERKALKKSRQRSAGVPGGPAPRA